MSCCVHCQQFEHALPVSTEVVTRLRVHVWATIGEFSRRVNATSTFA